MQEVCKTRWGEPRNYSLPGQIQAPFCQNTKTFVQIQVLKIA